MAEPSKGGLWPRRLPPMFYFEVGRSGSLLLHLLSWVKFKWREARGESDPHKFTSWVNHWVNQTRWLRLVLKTTRAVPKNASEPTRNETLVEHFCVMDGLWK